MALNIKNDEVEGAIRQLAERTGESLTTAIHQAVLDRLSGLAREAATADGRDDLWERISALRTQLGPYESGFMTDDLYDDETGLPR